MREHVAAAFLEARMWLEREGLLIPRVGFPLVNQFQRS
jgi:hypothetical protein